MSLSRSQCWLLLTLLVILAYGNSLENGFLWDDFTLVTNNSHIRNFEFIPIAFRSDLFHNDSPTAIRYYRPLQTVSYMADYALWGLNPFGYHLTNGLLHLFCAVLLFLLLEKLTSNRVAAFAVAALFAVHPVLTNAVTYVSGRADSLAFAAMLAAWCFWLERRPLAFTAAAFCYIAALCSRENAFLFPLLIVLHRLLLQRNDCRRALLDALPFAMLALAVALWRLAVLSLHGSAQPIVSLPWSIRAQLPFRALATYVGLLVWPAHLQMERQVVVGGNWLHVLTVAGALAVVGLVVLARQNPLARFGTCWFAVTLLPMCVGLIPNASVAEHWLYVPCAGLFLAVVSVLRLTRGAMFLLAGVLLALTARTAVRNREWRDPMTFYARTKGVAPHSAAVRANLGLEYAAAGRTNDALLELSAAQRIAPDSVHVTKHLAAIHLRQGNLSVAQGKVADALRMAPHHPDVLMQAAMIWERRGDVPKARLFYLRAMAQTLSVPLRLEYGQFLLRHRRYKEALGIAEEICALEPPNAEGHNLRGVVLAEMGRWKEAEAAFEVAARLDRHSPHAKQNLARLRALRERRRYGSVGSDDEGASLR